MRWKNSPLQRLLFLGRKTDMEKAKVYFTDFHTVAFGDGLPAKLKKLIKKAGIQDRRHYFHKYQR